MNDEGKGMEQRITHAEGDIRSLQEWKRDKVDPWLEKSGVFHSKTEKFMTSFEATEAVRSQLAEERHRSNSLKLNVLMVIAAFLSILFSALLALISYEAAHQKSFLNVPALHVDSEQYDARRTTIDSGISPNVAYNLGDTR